MVPSTTTDGTARLDRLRRQAVTASRRVGGGPASLRGSHTSHEAMSELDQRVAEILARQDSELKQRRER